MNRGLDTAGKPLPGGKKAAGAELLMTQPIFQTDLQSARRRQR